MKLKIKRNITLQYINELNQLVYSSEEALDIELPKTLKRNSFAVIPSFIQFFATVIRKSRCAKLILPFSSEDELTDYIRQEFVYPITVLAWNVDIKDKSDIDIKSKMAVISQDYFTRLEFLKIKVLRSLPIYSFDHDYVKRGLSRFFYKSDYSLVELDQLEFNLFPIFKKLSLAHNVRDNRNTLSPILPDLTEIIYELFKNTHEHGRTNIEGGYYFPSARSVTVRMLRRKKSDYLSDEEIPISVKEYFANNLPLTEQSDFIMLEVSVFDSGPGLACRYAKTSDLSSYTLEEELNITKECLLKHRTSSDAYLSAVKGEGLDKVMQLLDKKGFLKIRTGRLNLFRNFISDPYEESAKVEEIVLKDYTNNDLNYVEHPHVSGTLHTFYYPIGSDI